MDRLADFIARGMRPRLAAAGFDDCVPPDRRVPEKAPCDRAIRDMLYARAGKHLAAAVVKRDHEAAHAR
jgi:hypothetical protein